MFRVSFILAVVVYLIVALVPAPCLGSKRLVSGSRILVHSMAAKRDRDADDLSITGVDEWPGDVEWKEDNGLFEPFVLQVMKPGWESRASRATVETAGALHPDCVEIIESVHVILWSHQVEKALYTALDLHDVLHFTYPKVDDIVETVEEYNKRDGIDIGLSLYYPDQSYTDDEFLKVYFKGTDEWETVSDLYDELHMGSLAKSILKLDPDRGDRGNRQKTSGRAAIAFTKDDVTTVWKPTIRRGTTVKDVKNMSILTRLVHAIYGAGKFFTNDERTEVFGKE